MAVKTEPHTTEQHSLDNHSLVLAPTLRLPDEAVTETFAILAKRGSGKTYTAAVFVEELLKACLPVVVVDPVGVWWGLRLSADGKGPGLPIVILGGDHADIPLPPGAGAVVADLVNEERLSVLLDLSLMEPEEQTRFMTDFGRRLYQVNRSPLHLVLDEADQFVPQVPGPGQQPLLSAMNRIVRLGRARGLGVTLISQRPAVIAKNVLTQTEVLITLRLTSPQDRKAVDAWVSAHGTAGQREEMLSSLPSLPVGTAWFWSPAWLGVFEKVAIRRRETFDSSATPTVKRGAGNASFTAPITLAPLTLLPEEKTAGATPPFAALDLSRLAARIGATADAETLSAVEVETPRRMEARRAVRPNSPAEAPLLSEAELRALRASTGKLADDAAMLGAQAASVREEAVQATATLDVLKQNIAALTQMAEALEQEMRSLHTKADDLEAGASRIGIQAQDIFARLPALGEVPAVAIQQMPEARLVPKEKEPKQEKEIGREGASLRLPLAERKILTALAQYPAGCTKSQVALLTGYSSTGGGFCNALGALRSKGHLTGGSAALHITAAGRTALGTWERLPTGPALVEHWLVRLGKAERVILRALVEAHPTPLTKPRLGEATGYATEGGGFNNALSRLRTLQLIEGRAELRASATFFPG